MVGYAERDRDLVWRRRLLCTLVGGDGAGVTNLRVCGGGTGTEGKSEEEELRVARIQCKGHAFVAAGCREQGAGIALTMVRHVSQVAEE